MARTNRDMVRDCVGELALQNVVDRFPSTGKPESGILVNEQQ